MAQSRAIRLAIVAIVAAVTSAVPAGAVGLGPGPGRQTTAAAKAYECAADPFARAFVTSKQVTYTDEPSAGSWKTWFVGPNDIFVPPPPPGASEATARELLEVQRRSLTRDAATVETIRRWDGPAASKPWSLELLREIKAFSRLPAHNPPRISRYIALFQTAAFDALAIAWKAKYCYLRPPPAAVNPTITPAVAAPPAPSYPSEHAVVAGVASVLFPAIFSQDPKPGRFVATAEAAAQSRVAAGTNYPSDVSAGYELGRTVAEAALAARANDGSSAQWDGSGRITGPCNWEPTLPAFGGPAEPVWGKVRPWLMTSGSQLRPAAPPDCASAEYVAAARDLYEASRRLTDRQKAIAEYWAGGPGTETPPGMNLRLAIEAADRHDLGTMRHARVLAHVGAGLADAAIAAWDAKYAYWSDRPIHTIRRIWNPSWEPHIATPPFPGFVSGHATFSGTTAEILSGFFPDEAVLHRAHATEAAISRYYGGIHVRYDNEDGLTCARGLGALALARAAGDGAAGG